MKVNTSHPNAKVSIPLAFVAQIFNLSVSPKIVARCGDLLVGRDSWRAAEAARECSLTPISAREDARHTFWLRPRRAPRETDPTQVKNQRDGRLKIRATAERGSVLVIVLWVAFGLVSLALYFGHSMFFELRASDNNVAGIEAQAAIEGAARYLGYMLTNSVEPGQIPDVLTYECEEVPLGDATYWLIGRSDREIQSDTPFFGLIDEGSKLNLNTATVEMLQGLPRMTPQLAAAIIDWRDADSDITQNGAESETYQRLNPAYTCKNSKFESVEELRLVNGATPEILYGEDYNRNGILEENENDADTSLPSDNRDGRLDPGILEYLTVSSLEPNVRTNGEPRINISTNNAQLAQLLQEKGFNSSRISQIQARAQAAGGSVGSLLEFYSRSGMTADEFAQVESDLTVTNATVIEGLINVNTASAAVLACVPGITNLAQQLVAYRQTKSQPIVGLGWVTEVLTDANAIRRAGPYLTSHSYQFTADIAAVGHSGRGYRRTTFVFDTSESQSKILYRRDLGRLGWALGVQTRERTGELTQLTRRDR